MKRLRPVSLVMLLLTGCGGEAAKEMMDTQTVIILGAWEQSEYDGGHIPGAVLPPVGTIDETTAAQVIPEKDSAIYESGGIRTWPYETET